MKRLILTAVALVGLAVPFTAKAQNAYGSTTVSNNQIVAASTSFTNGTINATKQKTVGVQITLAYTNGGSIPANAMLWYFYRSADNQVFDSLPQIVGNAAQSVGTNSFSTNLDSSGLLYFKLITTNTIATTNLFSTVTYVGKAGTAQ